MTTIAKWRLPFLFLVLVSAPTAVAAQSEGATATVTLYNMHNPLTHKHDASRASINLETGRRGHLRTDPWTDFDLAYGGLVIEKDGKRRPDWFRVIDPRSMIVDLGKKEWSDYPETPAFPKPKKGFRPLPVGQRPMVLDVSGDSKDASPYRQFIEVQPGHIYLMRVLRGARAVYAMFRVEDLRSTESCVLSWKVVPPPRDTSEK